MSDEQARSMVGWTVPLKEHVEALQRAEDKYNQRFEAVVARVEESERADHDILVALVSRVEELRVAHAALHVKDNEQLGRDFVELQRRLDLLNHAHEEARRKETDFASKSEMSVATSDLIRRIESVTATVGICLPRETFDAAQRAARLDNEKRDGQIASLFIQIQGIAENKQGSTTGSQRVITLVFSLLGAAGVIVGIVLSLR